jgi:uncharacterized protein YndB with AHSA1/START domain
MERKTKIHAEDGKHEIVITREFDLPVELLFRAHTDAAIFEEWMTHEYATTKVVKWEGKKHGGWRFESRDAAGNLVFGANGSFHEIVPNKKITRTFEMENSPFDVQLDFLEFEQLSEERSKLTIHSIYRSVEIRDQLLKLPFAQGLSMAHDRLQDVLKKLK